MNSPKRTKLDDLIDLEGWRDLVPLYEKYKQAEEKVLGYYPTIWLTSACTPETTREHLKNRLKIRGIMED